MKKIVFIISVIIMISNQNAFAAHRHYHKAHHHHSHNHHNKSKAHKSSSEKIELCYPPEENLAQECFIIARKEYEEIIPTDAESEEAEEIIKSAERSEKESNHSFTE